MEWEPAKQDPRASSGNSQLCGPVSYKPAAASGGQAGSQLSSTGTLREEFRPPLRVHESPHQNNNKVAEL